MEPTLTETAQLAVTTTMEESPGPGQLPDDVFNQVLEYLDGPALLVSCRVDRTWAKSTESCSAAWRGAAGAEDADDWNSGRYLVWRARTAGIVVGACAGPRASSDGCRGGSSETVRKSQVRDAGGAAPARRRGHRSPAGRSRGCCGWPRINRGTFALCCVPPPRERNVTHAVAECSPERRRQTRAR